MGNSSVFVYFLFVNSERETIGRLPSTETVESSIFAPKTERDGVTSLQQHEISYASDVLRSFLMPKKSLSTFKLLREKQTQLRFLHKCQQSIEKPSGTIFFNMQKD